MFDKNNKQGRMYDFLKKVFIDYESQNIILDWMNVEFIQMIQGFKHFWQCLQPFSRMVGLFSLFNGISTFMDYLMPKTS